MQWRGGFLLISVSSFFLWTAWPPNKNVYFILISLAPVLYSYSVSNDGKCNYKALALSFIYLFFCNTSVTFWLYKLTYWALLVHLINSGIFTIPFLIFHFITNKYNRYIGYTYFILCWIILEYLQLHWDLAYPIMVLGNSISMYPRLFQWYEFTGVLGGTLWVLFVNVAICEVFASILNKCDSLKRALISLVIVIAITISFWFYYQYTENGIRVTVSVLNPNIDCRSEKDIMGTNLLTSRYLKMQDSILESDVIVWPETAIPNGGLINQLEQNTDLRRIKSELPSKTTLVTGAVVFENYGVQPEDRVGLFYYSPYNVWLKTYNALIEVSEKNGILFTRSKTRLVPFEEFTPYPNILSGIQYVFEPLGNYEFSTSRFNRKLLVNDGVAVIPLICYELLFGSDIANYITPSNQIITISLNEGWYYDYEGASQFFYYSTLRAVEFRRAIARSSNGGISGFINQRGQPTIFNKSITKKNVLTDELMAGNDITFYSKHGDYLGTISSSILIVLSLALAILRMGQSHLPRRINFLQ